MQIRRLNENGIERFRENLQQIRAGETNTLDTSLLSDESLSQPLDEDVAVEPRSFKTKKEISEYLTNKLNLLDDTSIYYDVGLWTWLSVFYFDLVCPVEKRSKKILADPHYILSEPKNWRRYYRHLLACPARLYCELGESATAFLEAPVAAWGEFREQLTAYQKVATNKPLIAAATMLYWNPSSKNLKKGAGSKGPGSVRRFIKIVDQFDLTYDINAMEVSQILELLPQAEFAKWMVREKSST